MNIKKFKQVLDILCKYDGVEEDYMCAEHGEIYLPGPDVTEMDPEDVIALDKLGAWWSEEVNSWGIFT